MGKTMCDLHYAFVVTDSEEWSAEELAAAEADGWGATSDWAVAQLDAHIRRAAEQFMAAHPRMFVSDTLG